MLPHCATLDEGGGTEENKRCLRHIRADDEEFVDFEAKEMKD